ncbi:hypothetical protein GCM10027599_19070 [Yimella radicis]
MAASSRDGLRRVALNWAGRPYWQAGWAKVWPHEESLINHAFTTQTLPWRPLPAGHVRLG